MPQGMGSELLEQPDDSDRNVKLQRRKARMGGGTVLCTDHFRARDLTKRGETQEGPAGDTDTSVLCPRLV